ncbi:MAG: ZIP family metal transporter [Candidatus Komeilibacteria bacterium]|nr:ZIP family metal transporter [Candidatus Komeilibacteria bacterium]
MPILYTLGSVVIISLISLIGVVVIFANTNRLNKFLFLLVSLAVGALFGDVFFHILPELYEEMDTPLVLSAMILMGILIFFILEKFLHWHHHHNHEHEIEHEECIKPFGYVNLFSDGLHNLIDGMIVAAAFLVDINIGIATTVAVILHEVPQEISDFGLLLHAGFSKGKALLFNLLSASLALIGAMLVFLIKNSSENFVPYALAFTAGGFIYLAGSDLVPELHKEKGVKKSLAQLLMVIVGIALMYVLTLAE